MGVVSPHLVPVGIGCMDCDLANRQGCKPLVFVETAVPGRVRCVPGRHAVDRGASTSFDTRASTTDGTRVRGVRPGSGFWRALATNDICDASAGPAAEVFAFWDTPCRDRLLRPPATNDPCDSRLSSASASQRKSGFFFPAAKRKIAPKSPRRMIANSPFSGMSVTCSMSDRSTSTAGARSS